MTMQVLYEVCIFVRQIEGGGGGGGGEGRREREREESMCVCVWGGGLGDSNFPASR